MLKKLPEITLIVLFLLCTVMVSSDNVMSTNESTQTNIYINSQLTLSEPIVIYQDSDFVSTHNFSGSGTSESPYLIENLFFNLNESHNPVAIEIHNTRANFLIQNCVIQGINEMQEIGDPDEWMWVAGIGIELWNVSNGAVQNCNFSIFGDGIFLFKSSNISITDNTFSGMALTVTTHEGAEGGGTFSNDIEYHGKAINMQDYSEDNIINSNTITNCSTGIWFRNVTHNMIDRNHVSKSDHGIASSHYSIANTIMNNTCTQNRYGGIFLATSNDTLVLNNTCVFNGYFGIWVSESSSNNIIDSNFLSLNGLYTINITTTPSMFFAASEEEVGYGVWVHQEGTNNSVLWNDIVDNEVNARNDAGDNLYDYNYYSDYIGVDLDSNGIGDTPYEIGGDTPTLDYHPRVDFTDASVITTDTDTDFDMADIMNVSIILGFSGVLIVLVIVLLKKK
ncbi:MAG: right-handed parallel beta-helix repeat-containing protein [Candidatus Thorarchaeota archaeon]|jgi:parallel beta-helix repeat protein